jgi:Family of unknown function (DUF5719)
VRGLFANRLVLAVLVLMAMAALYGVADLSHPVAETQSTQPSAMTHAAVSSAIRACPSPGSAAPTFGGVALASAPAASATRGQAVVTRFVPAGTDAAGTVGKTVLRPGRLTVMTVPRAPAAPARPPATSDPVPTVPGRGGVVVQATGSMAQGLEVEQTGANGLVTARCEAPGTEFWFVGPGPQAVRQIKLYLMNVDGQPADAQVSAMTDSGPLLASSDTGIVVPPHGLVIQSLAKLLHGAKSMALQVSTSVGRIVAAVRETKNGADPGGWLPATQPPAKRFVLPGLPGVPGTRELYLAVPGTGNAQVKLTAITPRGSYQPTGGSGINLPGGSAVGFPLPSLGGIPAAIEVSSNVPVTASIMLPGGAAGAPGVFTVAAAPVLEQGLIARDPGSASGSAELVLSAPRTAATVRISEATSATSFGAHAGRLVHIAAGRTLAERVHPPAGSPRTAAFAVLLTPQHGSGPVYAARVIRSGGAVASVLPVESSLTQIPLSSAQDTLTVVLPGKR